MTMHRTHYGFAFVLAASLGTAAIAAQTTQPLVQSKTAQKEMKASEKDHGTITGCIERRPAAVVTDDRSSVAPPGDPGLPVYRLTHVEASELKAVLDAAPRPPGAAQPSATEINLQAEGKTDLAAHLGHKVELSGQVAPEKKSDEPPVTTSSTPTQAKAGHGAVSPTFQVTSVKMISSSCQ
jgi:hypothetical protein